MEKRERERERGRERETERKRERERERESARARAYVREIDTRTSLCTLLCTRERFVAFLALNECLSLHLCIRVGMYVTCVLQRVYMRVVVGGCACVWVFVCVCARVCVCVCAFACMSVSV